MHLQNKQQHVLSATLTLREGRKYFTLGGIASQSHTLAHQCSSDFYQFQKPVHRSSDCALERMHETFFSIHLPFCGLHSPPCEDHGDLEPTRSVFVFSKWYQSSHGQLIAYYWPKSSFVFFCAMALVVLSCL